MNAADRTGPADRAPLLTVVIPFFNEAESVAALLAELRGAVSTLDPAAEIIAVNDGSTDATGCALDTVAEAWPESRVKHFPQNQRSTNSACGLNRLRREFTHDPVRCHKLRGLAEKWGQKDFRIRRLTVSVPAVSANFPRRPNPESCVTRSRHDSC